jgi:hypothetical protein
VEDANDRLLRSSQTWTDGAARFLQDYVAESNDAATATERAFANAFSGAEDSLVGFIATGKLEFQGLADSILADLARTTVRQTLTAPLAGALQSAFACGGLFGLFHEGGIAGERPSAVRYAKADIFDQAPGTTTAASPARASCRTRSRSSPGAASWSYRPSGSCARRSRHVSSGRLRWWSTSPPRTRARFVRARAKLRPTWRARLTERLEIADNRFGVRRPARSVTLADAVSARPRQIQWPGSTAGAGAPQLTPAWFRTKQHQDRLANEILGVTMLLRQIVVVVVSL